MSQYMQLGSIPKKRHTVYPKPDGGMYQEEVFGTEGFSGKASLVYHLHPPTLVKEMGESYSIKPKIAIEEGLKAMSFQGFNVSAEADYIKSRKVLFINNDMTVGLAAPSESMTDYFFKNADADEMIFVHEGSGILHSPYGKVDFEKGDYLIVPRGTVYKMEFENAENRLLIVESYSPIRTPQRYRNEYGQFLEHSPFCERDFKLPYGLETIDQTGDFLINIKKKNRIYPYTYGTHPFDLVGWDGCNYPYAFPISQFEPLTGRIHMPPPIHQTFEGHNFVICSFVPRLYDYHPDAIPAPYHHSNVDADELLYYVDGDFMSRNNIKPGQFTLHPGGIPHGPHPGAIERSIGQKETKETAVMIDPFNPVMITEEALNLEVKDYHKSWIAEPQTV